MGGMAEVLPLSPMPGHGINSDRFAKDSQPVAVKY
jgi:hypothetical protein